MSYQASITSVALASATSANGTARTGTALPTNNIEPGTLSLECTSSIDTSSVIATFKVQVSKDNSTWQTMTPLGSALVSSVSSPGATSPAGTGSTVVTHIAVPVDMSMIAGWPYIRATAVLAGAGTASADVTAVNYRYMRRGTLLR